MDNDVQQRVKEFLEFDCYVGVKVIDFNGEETLTDSKWVQANVDFDTYNYIYINKNSILLNYADKGIMELIAL